MTVATLSIPAEDDGGLKKNQAGWFRKVFNKVADSAGRSAVTNTLKIAVVSTLAGAGASSVLTVGAAAVAAGMGAALYSYGKDLTIDLLHARKTGAAVALWDRERAKRARLALLVGTAGGAFGAWLAGTDTFKFGIGMLKETGAKAAGWLSGIFIQSASAAELPQGLVASPKNPLEKLWVAAMKSDRASGKFIGELFKSDPSDMKSVAPQYLKDRAHDILRIKDLPWADRLETARALAEEAKARGNRQAVQFLKDLVKLEKLHGGVMPHAAMTDTLQQVEMPEIAPIKTVILDTDAAGHVTERIVDAESAAPLVIVDASEPLQRRFEEAALCSVSPAAAADELDASCVIHKSVMEPGDYISFVRETSAGFRPVVPLAPDSIAVETENFLNEKTIAEGIAKLKMPGVQP